MSKTDLTVWIVASIFKYIKTANLGLPVKFKQIPDEAEPITVTIKDGKDHDAEVQFVIFGPNYPRVGSSKEVYAEVTLQATLKNKAVPSDLFYHHRIKGKLAEVMAKSIPVSKIGNLSYDKTQVGFLAPVPTESIELMPVESEVQEVTFVTQTYKLEVC